MRALGPKIVAVAVLALCVIAVPSTASAATPRIAHLGTFTGIAVSDGSSAVIAPTGAGTVKIFRDGSATGRAVTLPGCQGLVDASSGLTLTPSYGAIIAASSGSALSVCVTPPAIGGGPPYTPTSTFSLINLTTGAARPLPGADKLVTLPGHQPMLFTMGRFWAFGQPCYDDQAHCDPQVEINWHTGEVRTADLLPSIFTLSPGPLTALDSPTLTTLPGEPTVTFTKTTLTYRRGALRRRVAAHCGCDSAVVNGWRVAWTSGAGRDAQLHVVNARTGARKTVPLASFPGAGTAGAVDVPHLVATSRRIIVSLSAGTQVQEPHSGAPLLAISAIRWPV